MTKALLKYQNLNIILILHYTLFKINEIINKCIIYLKKNSFNLKTPSFYHCVTQSTIIWKEKCHNIEHCWWHPSESHHEQY